MRALLAGCTAAAGMWFILFWPTGAGRVNFWAGMTAASGSLSLYGLICNRRAIRDAFAFRGSHVPAGLISAAGLYLVFLLGDAAARVLLPFAAGQIGRIYAMRSQLPPWAIALLLLWIAPAEEVFWRGFVQERLARRLGPWGGFLAATAVYAGVHVWALNAVLLAAAGVCGLAWGWMFLRYRSLWPGLICHAAWDVAVFVLLPIDAGV